LKNYKRAKRRQNSYNKYKKRLKLWIEFLYDYKNEIETWRDLMESDWSKHLKDTPHPCSCEGCSGGHFNRRRQKEFDKRIIEQGLIDKNTSVVPDEDPIYPEYDMIEQNWKEYEKRQ